MGQVGRKKMQRQNWQMLVAAFAAGLLALISPSKGQFTGECGAGSLSTGPQITLPDTSTSAQEAGSELTISGTLIISQGTVPIDFNTPEAAATLFAAGGTLTINSNPFPQASDDSGGSAIDYTLLGDASLEGVVDPTDFAIIQANFDKGMTSSDPAAFSTGALVVNGPAEVPEPASTASITLIAMIGLAVLPRRFASRLA
jgi:hypothetical protein